MTKGLIAILGVLPSAAHAAIAFQITSIGAGDIYYDAINDRGQVVINEVLGDGSEQTLLLANGKTEPIFGPNGTPGVITAPNRAGVSLGFYVANDQRVQSIWANNRMAPLQIPAGVGSIDAMNDLGQMLGFGDPSSGSGPDALLLRNGKVQNLGSLGTGTTVSGEVQRFAGGQLNDRGQVAGQVQEMFSDPSLDGIRSSFWSDGHATDLGTLGGAFTYESALNNRGVVVGASDVSATIEHGFVWQNGKMKDVGTLPGDTWSQLTGINDLDVAIGDSGSGSIGDAVDHPVIWSDGRLTSIASLIPANSGWDVQSLDDINDRDQIVGLGLFDGQERAFLLTPTTAQFIPEPSAMGLACAGLLLLRRARRR